MSAHLETGEPVESKPDESPKKDKCEIAVKHEAGDKEASFEDTNHQEVKMTCGDKTLGEIISTDKEDSDKSDFIEEDDESKAPDEDVSERLKNLNTEEIGEKSQGMRYAEQERGVSLRIAIGILALSVLIYAGFIVYTEPLRVVIIRSCKDLFSYLVASPLFFGNQAEDVLPPNLPLPKL